jgi:hypothetical protein
MSTIWDASERVRFDYSAEPEYFYSINVDNGSWTDAELNTMGRALEAFASTKAGATVVLTSINRMAGFYNVTVTP